MLTLLVALELGSWFLPAFELELKQGFFLGLQPASFGLGADLQLSWVSGLRLVLELHYWSS